MIAPSYWVDPKSGNNYFVTVQYPGESGELAGRLKNDAVARSEFEVAHLSQSGCGHHSDTHADRSGPLPVATNHRRVCGSLRRRSGQAAKGNLENRAGHAAPPNIRVNVRGLVTTMQSSFRSFGFGLLLSILLVYLVLVAQFSSFIDPFLIILAVPTGLVGVMLTLAFTTPRSTFSR